jgi:hypothetical protein
VLDVLLYALDLAEDMQMSRYLRLMTSESVPNFSIQLFQLSLA